MNRNVFIITLMMMGWFVPIRGQYFRSLDSGYIEEINITDDRNNAIVLYPVDGIRNDSHAYNLIINEGLVKYEVRKECYIRVLKAMVFEEDFEIAEILTEVTGSGQYSQEEITDMTSFWVSSFSTGYDFAQVITGKGIAKLNYIKNVNSYTETVNQLKTMGREIRNDTHLGNILSFLSAVQNAADAEENYTEVLRSLVIDAARTDIAIKRIQDIERTSGSSDSAFWDALTEVRRDLKNLPTDFWIQIKNSLDLRMNEFGNGTLSSADALNDIYSLLTTSGAPHWIGAILFTGKTIWMIDDFHKQFQGATVAATLYKDIQRNVDSGKVSPNEITNSNIEYSQYLFLKMMNNALSKWPMKFWEWIIPSRAEPRQMMSDEMNTLREAIIERRLRSIFVSKVFSGETIPERKKHPAENINSFMIILDTSDSMNEIISGHTDSKMVFAKNALYKLLSYARKHGMSDEWAMMIFMDCDNTPVIQPFTRDITLLESTIRSVGTYDRTPLAMAIRNSAEHIINEASGKEAQIVLLTDGEETCDGDPVEEARRIGMNYSGGTVSGIFNRLMPGDALYAGPRSTPIKIRLNVILIDTANVDMEGQLKAIAEAGGGKFYTASNTEDLVKSLKSSTVGSSHTFFLWFLAGISVIGSGYFIFRRFSKQAPHKEKLVFPNGFLMTVVNDAEYKFPLNRNQQIKIGREADNDLVLQSQFVSGHHAMIQFHQDQPQPVVIDLGSSNGTFVNQQKIIRANVQFGDQIKFADVVFIYKEGSVP